MQIEACMKRLDQILNSVISQISLADRKQLQMKPVDAFIEHFGNRHTVNIHCFCAMP